jgi:hypothetical protein
MLDMKLNSGKFTIDDNNEAQVDETIAKQIIDGFDENEENKDKNKPNLTIKD